MRRQNRINASSFGIMGFLGLLEPKLATDRQFGVCTKCGRTFKTKSGKANHLKNYHDAHEARKAAVRP